jgi:CTP:molybdopterin cytidylyltransferase MocA
MFSSVRKGVASIAGKCRGFFVLPADMPLVKPDTLQTLMAAFGEEGKFVFRPCYNGKHGHPPLISSSLIPAILEFTGAGGLRAFFARLESSVANIECNDPGILEDLDTPEDYRRALERFEPGIS